MKLFHHFNPTKFKKPYQQIKDFDYVTHRNVINTYEIAVRKLKAKDSTTRSFIVSCLNLSIFSKNFVDQTYPRAISYNSKNNPLSDQFFNEINNIVLFDDSIGDFDITTKSFKQYVSTYKQALLSYKNKFKDELVPKTRH